MNDSRLELIADFFLFCEYCFNVLKRTIYLIWFEVSCVTYVWRYLNQGFSFCDGNKIVWKKLSRTISIKFMPEDCDDIVLISLTFVFCLLYSRERDISSSSPFLFFWIHMYKYYHSYRLSRFLKDSTENVFTNRIKTLLP